MGINFREWNEDKLTFVKVRMRKLEFFRFKFFLVIEEEVKVDCSWTPSKGFLAAETQFNPLQGSEELASVKGCFNLDDAIHKPILGAVSERLRSVKGGLGQESVAVDSQDFRKGFLTPKKFVPDV